jgi:hypothetical protein
LGLEAVVEVVVEVEVGMVVQEDLIQQEPASSCKPLRNFYMYRSLECSRLHCARVLRHNLSGHSA